MSRSPSVWLACKVVDLTQRRGAPASIETRRAAVAARPAPIGDVGGGVRVSERDVPVDGDSIKVRIHRPNIHGRAGDRPQPAHVLLHSGAFCYGAPVEVDALARLYAETAACTVLSVGYRLAPEHPYPTALEDSYAALQWTVDNANELGVDPRRVSIGGVSAGGCLAAGVALMARDRGGPALVFQLLEIPVTDLTASSASVNRYAAGHLLTRADMFSSYASYLPDPARRKKEYASPLFVADLAGLPPTMVLTAECDPLRDEGEAYAHRLIAAGVATQVVRAKGHVHSSTYSSLPSAKKYPRMTAAALAGAYAAVRPA
jgi:acetyl esterase